jgi:anti-anti-sigma regulatory factor
LPLSRAWRRTSQLTLRISIEQNPDAVTIKLEGRIAGPWAAELGRTWNSLAHSLDGRSTTLDLRGVTYVDANGKQTLKAIYRDSGAHMLTASPLTQYFAQEITR